MKRYVLATLLAFTLCTHVLGGTVTLVSSEGQEFTLDESVARLSGLIESVIDVADAGTNLPFAQISSDHLQTITEDLKSLHAWYEQQHQHPLPLYEHNENIASRIQSAKQYATETPPTAIDVQKALALLKATDYLNVPELKHRYARDLIVLTTDDPLTLFQAFAHYTPSPDITLAVIYYLRKDNILLSSPSLSRDITHYSKIYSVAFSPDGTRLATTSENATAYVGVALGKLTGKKIYVLQHSGPVYSAIFSPDSTQLATASYDRTARVSNALTGRQMYVIQHGSAVNSVAFSSDGTQLATASDDHTARVSNALTGEQMYVIQHGSAVNSVAFSPDGTQLTTVSDDHAARVSNALTGEQMYVIQHDRPVYSVTFSHDNTRLATVSWDGTTRVTYFPFLGITNLKQLIAVLIAHKTGLKNITDESLRYKVAATIAMLTEQQRQALLPFPRRAVANT